MQGTRPLQTIVTNRLCMTMLKDFDHIRQFELLVCSETEPPIEIALRRMLVGVSGLVLWIAMGEVLTLLWAIGYIVGDLVYVRFLRTYRNAPSVTVFWSGIAASLFLGLWVGGMAVMLSSEGSAPYYFLAGCLVIGQSLHCLSSHSSFSASVLADLVVVIVTGFGITFSIASNTPEPNLSFAVVIGMLCVQVYFVHSVVKVILERQALAKRLTAEAQGEKMKALGQFTSGVAHDFNNLLTVISGNIELARLNNLPRPVDEVLEEAYTSSKSAAHLVKQLLAYARKSRLQSGKVKVQNVLGNIESVAARLLPANIALETQNSDPEAFVKADGSMLETALLNLVINARDAIGTDAGRIVISTSYRDGQSFLGISVSDDGPGMSPEILKECVDPFYSTKPVGKGSGLGLSMVKGFAEQSGGVLRIQNRDVAGLCAEVRLPVFQLA